MIIDQSMVVEIVRTRTVQARFPTVPRKSYIQARLTSYRRDAKKASNCSFWKREDGKENVNHMKT